jgi:hypothetical protein
MLEPRRKYCPYPAKTLDVDAVRSPEKFAMCAMNDELFVHNAGNNYITVYGSGQHIAHANLALVRFRPDWFRLFVFVYVSLDIKS